MVAMGLCHLWHKSPPWTLRTLRRSVAEPGPDPKFLTTDSVFSTPTQLLGLPGETMKIPLEQISFLGGCPSSLKSESQRHHLALCKKYMQLREQQEAEFVLQICRFLAQEN